MPVSYRMFAAVQKKKISCEIFVNHFKENKVEIANAITKPFPFLESLRHNSFITEKIYTDSQEACINLIPVQRVVYQALCHLEKVFDCSVLSVLFSRINLKEYPDLIEVHKSFKKVLPFSQKRDGKETPKMSSFQPSCKQGHNVWMKALFSGLLRRKGDRKPRSEGRLHCWGWWQSWLRVTSC
ncbi:nuclear body protein SP140-like protein isoform X2 [Rhinopithecus roxellana]|uniref:nuclear body protein SP140-like protein isoform X2 n=1 Tax=Rhinopithecus roxellana TaxID=61622 RepID=UPI0012378879|nr:nuclear body protein SP140-like protein isoform X2 [Rhinopithecus roxellana]